MKKYSLLVLSFITITIIFCCACSFIANAQETVTFETITEALNYDGDKDAVKKLIITGEIAGEDYSDESEWSMFRFLDETFPQIEEVELLTDQDLLDADEAMGRSLFYWNGPEKADWLKKFSAPNTKYIGSYNFSVCENLEEIYFPSVIETGIMAFGYCNSLKHVDFPELIKTEAFYNCEGLVSANLPKAKILGSLCFYRCYSLEYADFPEVTTIGGMSFSLCSNMVSINLPSITSIGNNAFTGCSSLTSISFGTVLETETEIDFGIGVFGYNENNIDTQTENIDLVLGKYLLPKPIGNVWQETYSPYVDFDYVWKSITIEYVRIEEDKEETIDLFCIEKNVYSVNNISELELYDLTGRLIMEFNNAEIIDLNNLFSGCYFLKCTNNKKINIKKLIKN